MQDQIWEHASMPLVSIITPTFNRAALLPALWRCISAQSTEDFEWLVLDDSSERATIETIADKRLTYFHSTTRMHIGAKRNLLCERAKADVIAFFDDDDYYAPHYLSSMLSLMARTGADIVKLFGFYLYHQQNEFFGYCALQHSSGFCYRLQPNDSAVLTTRDVGDDRIGYGFSYVFKKVVWNKIRFSDHLDHGEDAEFVKQAIDAGFKFDGMDDLEYVSVHVIHAGNISRCFPQYRLPRFLLDRLFPHFSDMIVSARATAVGAA